MQRSSFAKEKYEEPKIHKLRNEKRTLFPSPKQVHSSSLPAPGNSPETQNMKMVSLADLQVLLRAYETHKLSLKSRKLVTEPGSLVPFSKVT